MPYTGLKSYDLPVRKFLNSENHILFWLDKEGRSRTSASSQHWTAVNCFVAQALLGCFRTSRKIPRLAGFAVITAPQDSGF